MKSVLLDTNAYVSFLTGNKVILDVLAQAEAIHLSVIVLGELHAGFCGGNKRGENEKILAEFMTRPGVAPLMLTLETAEIFGEVKSGLKRTGTPIPINDAWLAAQSIETGSVLVSLDAHFRHVPGLRLWNS